MLTNYSIFIFIKFKHSILSMYNVYTYVIVFIHKLYCLYYILTNSFKQKNVSTLGCIKIYQVLFLSWGRVIFRGKGFRVRVFRESSKLTLNFGHSHWAKLHFKFNWDFFKLKRQNYLFFSSVITDYLLFKLKLPNIRVVNRYTLRGLRLRRQCVKKRFGKISQYISSLH